MCKYISFDSLRSLGIRRGLVYCSKLSLLTSNTAKPLTAAGSLGRRDEKLRKKRKTSPQRLPYVGFFGDFLVR